MIGHILCKFYRNHHEVVDGAIEYTGSCWDLVMGYGLSPHKWGLDGSCDGPETRAYRFVLSFFSWLDTQYLGLGDNISLYQTSQKDLALFADTYETMWNHGPAYFNLSTSRSEWLPESNCMTATLYQFQNWPRLKGYVGKLKSLRLQLVVEQFDERKAAAKEKAEAKAKAATAVQEELVAEVGNNGEACSEGEGISEATGNANGKDDASAAVPGEEPAAD